MITYTNKKTLGKNATYKAYIVYLKKKYFDFFFLNLYGNIHKTT